MSSDADQDELQFDRVSQTVILNALIDLHADETILLDEETEQTLTEVVESVTTPEERSTVSDELDRLSTLEKGDFTDIKPELYDYVTTVTDKLTEEGYSLSVTHEYDQEISALNAHLYSFLQTHDVERLKALDVSSAVEDALVEGARLLDDDDPEGASSAFSEAVDRAASQTETVVAKTMAAWSHFLAKEDETATELVEEVTDLDESVWAAKIVGSSVVRNKTNDIRSGAVSVGLILRWASTGNENTSTRAEIGKRSDDGEFVWSEIHHYEGNAFLDEVYPETGLRFTLEGELPDFPTIQAYYVGVGIYENEIDNIYKVLHRLGQGPNRTDTVEQISIHR